MAATDSMGRQIATRPSSSDPTPAIQLRVLLEERRASGEPWSDEMFNELVGTCVRGLTLTQRAEWLAAFSDQRNSVWRAAYRRELRVRHGLANVS